MKKNNSIIKLILFLLFFMIVLTIFLLVYIIPSLKQYKSNKIVLNRYEKLYKKEKKTLDSFINRKNKIQKQYKDEILKFNNKFDEEKFTIFIKEFMQDVSIDKIPNKNELLAYNIEGSIKKINNLYDLIEKLNQYENFIKINFPLDYKVENKNILLKFNVTILHH